MQKRTILKTKYRFKNSQISLEKSLDILKDDFQKRKKEICKIPKNKVNHSPSFFLP